MPEWIHVLRAGLNRERAAMIVTLTAVAVAVLVTVVFPAIAGRIG